MIGVGLFQPWHLLLILLIVLVVFGAGKLSQVGGALGQSVKEFKATVKEDDAEQPAGDAPDQPALLARGRNKAETVIAPAARPTELLQREEI